MPPLPPPPISTRHQTPQSTTNAQRRPPSASSTRSGTGKLQPIGVPGRLPATKTRGENEPTSSSRPPNRTARRQTSTGIAGASKEKPPSKDGTAQRTAREVEGLKDYQLGECVGRGAFGSVYKALNWSTGETVAIKQVKLTDLPKAELNVIMQEIDLLKNLHHENIVKYHGFVKSQDALYIVLEFCENGSLHNICKNFGKFPENLVALYTAQVLQGLNFLHEQGVIHRDIKGANILTTKQGHVKLADFGVATKEKGISEGSVVGTPYWMAPEVIELSGASTASDIWSLGCTVIELLDGKPPYHKFAPMPALFRIVNDDHPPLPEGVSPHVRDFLMQCFQKDPNLRISARKLLKHPWILSAKKGDRGTTVMDPDVSVKMVQEWNQWLASSPKESNGNAVSLRTSGNPGSRPMSRGDGKVTKKYQTPATNTRTRLQANQTNGRGAKHFASPDEDETRDNWDDDFESISTKISALQIPDHLKPQDNFAGLLSSERLKSYASFEGVPEVDGKVEEWDEEFEGSLTVRSPLRLSKGDTVENVRPSYTPWTTSDEIKHKPPSSLARRGDTGEHLEMRTSKDSQPNTQILRAAPKPTASAHTKSTALLPATSKLAHATTAAKDSYRENDEENYSDLVADDEEAFKRKLAGFSPRRPVNPNDLRRIQTQLGGSVAKRRIRTPTSLVHDAAAMRRTRSSLEIQKYAEDDEDEDFTDIHFGEDQGAPMALQPVKTRSPKSISGGSDGTTGSERETLKLSQSFSSLEDEDEEDYDPFAALEEELDEVDLESNVARDKHARLCTLVEGLVSDLKLSQTEDALADIADELLRILYDSPDVKSVIVSSHGMLPVLEILDTCTKPPTILRLLKIVNCIISDNVEVQENLCFVGGIPIISKYAHKKYSSEIRLEAAAFVRMMFQTSTLTLQMFVSCGGLNVLVEFLEEDYESGAGRELVLIGVNGIWSVFELQGPTPKNDFCRIFSRSSVLYPLSLVLNRVLEENGDEAQLIEGRIVNIFLLFSQAENHVKETVADRMVLKRVLKDLRRMSPQHQITMLKFIKNLSMLATTLDALQNSNAIEVLTDLLGASLHALHFREISNQVLNTMYNLCRLSKARQEDAALSGVIPLLQRIVQTERPLKEFALPILCDMAHSGKVGRKILWQNKGLHFYVSLLADQYWAVTALDAIFIWLQEETAKVEEHLLASSSKFSSAIVQCFNESKADAFENLLEPLQKLLRLSPPIAASLAQRTLFERSAVKLHAKKPLVRLNLLRVIRSICEASPERGNLLGQYGLLDVVEETAKTDQAILVREMANELVKSSEQGSANAGVSGMRYVGLRRSSSVILTSPAIIPSSSLSPTASMERTQGRSGYFDLGEQMTRPRPNASSPFGPGGRESSSSTVNSIATKHRLPPRANASNLHRPGSRLGLAPLTTRDSGSGSAMKTLQERGTPTHSPPSANTRSSVAVANARRRRQTSSAEMGRG